MLYYILHAVFPFLLGAIAEPLLTPQLIHKIVSNETCKPPGVLIYHPQIFTALRAFSILTDRKTKKEIQGLLKYFHESRPPLGVESTNSLILDSRIKILNSSHQELSKLGVNLQFMNFVLPRKTLEAFNTAVTFPELLNVFPPILQRRNLDNDTEMISVGTATVCTRWHPQVIVGPTQFKAFHSQLDRHGKNRVVAIKTMCLYGNFSIDEFEGLQLLKLPLENNQTLIILQNSEIGMHAPNPSNPLDLLKRGHFGNTQAEIPVIDFQFRAEFVPRILRKLGIRRIYNMKAKFNKLTHQKIRLSNMIHATALRIDEFGINQSPHKHLMGSDIQTPEHRYQFIADQPFYFAIVSPSQVLFTGEFSDP